MSKCDLQIVYDRADRTYRGGEEVTGTIHIYITNNQLFIKRSSQMLHIAIWTDDNALTIKYKLILPANKIAIDNG